MIDSLTRPIPVTVAPALTPDEQALIDAVRRARAQSNGCTRLLVVRVEHDKLGVMPCETVRWHNRNR